MQEEFKSTREESSWWDLGIEIKILRGYVLIIVQSVAVSAAHDL